MPADDTVDLSEHARAMEALHRSADIRKDLVSRVRAQIDQGEYLTDERLEQAIDALLDDLLKS